MKKSDMVSVIVPIYNSEKYLRRCLDSIVNQSYKNIEIILIDDGSTDKSGNICDEYAEKDKRIKVVHQKNRGASVARNVGIGNAKGKWITFVDSDDYITADSISYLLNLAKEYNAKMAVATYCVIGPNGKVVKPRCCPDDQFFNDEDALKRLLLENGFTVSPNAKLISRKICKKNKFPAGRTCEDNGTVYKYIIESGGVAYGSKSIYFYCKNRNSTMNCNFTLKKMDLLILSNEMCRNIIKKFPNLKQATDEKMIAARFSILRMIDRRENRPEVKKVWQEQASYLKNHKKEILFKNKCMKKKDKIALLSLMLGKKFFYFSWSIYTKCKYGSIV